MTDRVHSLTVILEQDTRLDDLQPLITAITLFEGVAEVVPLIADPVSRMAEARALQKIRVRVYAVLEEHDEEPLPQPNFVPIYPDYLKKKR